MKHILLCAILFPITVFAQIGGTSTFEFTTLPYSATENAFGGNVITRTETDLAFALKNPSLLDSSYNNEVVGSWGLLHLKETGIGYGNIGYAYYLGNGITLDGGIHFVNYGKFDGYDEYGNSIAGFFPIEYEIILGGSYSINENISVGTNIKPIMSYMESYSSYGLLFDLGATYRNGNSCLSLVARNVGWQLKSYTKNNNEPVPYSIDFGYSQKLAHAPIRFSITYEDLQKFDLSYIDNLSTSNTILNEDDEEDSRKFADVGKNFIKHIDLSAEFLIGKNIVLMGGYNYRKSEELSSGDSKHGCGLSAGFALNFSRFGISYGWAKQHVAGGRNLFTLKFNAEQIYSVYKNTIQKNQK